MASSGAARKGIKSTDGAVVFVVDKHHKPLQPTTERRARKLLKAGRAVVHRRYPFVIRVKDRTVGESSVAGVQVGIDPGSRHTGLAVFTEQQTGDDTDEGVQRTGLWLAQVDHRGQQISRNLAARAALRRGRRSRNLRYRKPRFYNRHPQQCDSCGRNAQHGKRLCRPCQVMPRTQRGRNQRPVRLAPSLQHRVDGVTSWIARLRRWAPVTGIHMELVRFDLHAMQTPGIAGVEYQQGTLAGFEVREYLLAKWRHRCAYCDATGVGPGSVPLNIDHIRPRNPKFGPAGSDRVSNLALACIECNQAKGNQPVETFLADKPTVLRKVVAQAKAPMHDAAAVNTTRWALHNTLTGTGLPVATGSGGHTKYNRSITGTPKTHALDALCVGTVDAIIEYPSVTTVIGCTGRGIYQRAMPDKFGFSRSHRTRTKVQAGFKTGDRVRAEVPAGKFAGTHIGRVMVRTKPTFAISCPGGQLDVHRKYLTLLQHGDGYTYTAKET